jgi:hypothetical protein
VEQTVKKDREKPARTICQRASSSFLSAKFAIPTHRSLFLRTIATCFGGCRSDHQQQPCRHRWDDDTSINTAQGDRTPKVLCHLICGIF